MKKNKKIIISIISILIIGLIILLYNLFSDNENKLTLSESKWIDSNKYNVIDIALINDIPILSYEGDGLVYDYLDYITDKDSLNFNIISYNIDDTIEYDYKIELKNKNEKDDIVLLKDNLVLLTYNNIEYNDITNIDNIKVGILSNDLELLSNIDLSDNIEFVEYTTYTDLLNDYDKTLDNIELDITDNVIDSIILPKILITEDIIKNDYNISYNFNGINKYITLSTNGDTDLNSILKKEYNNWKNDNYLESYNTNFISDYYIIKNINDSEQKKLLGKSFVYGFIDYGVYNYISGKKINGLNYLLLKDFNSFSNISIKYTKYNSISKMLDDFNSNKIDFTFNIIDDSKITTDIEYTLGVYDKNLIVLSGINNTSSIDSEYSLKNKEIMVVRDSYLETYLNSLGAKLKLYNNISDLVTDFNTSSLAIIDLENFNYYKTSKLVDTKINFVLNLSEKYNFIVNKEGNEIFYNLFNFYLNYNSVSNLVARNYEDISYNNTNIYLILIIIILILLAYVVLDFMNHVKVMLKRIRKNRKINLSKEDKIKYIDQLTSLKNRNYFNSRIDSWDDSEVYPQAIIVIDLNNISYINDNYGREEGDKVITEAANILIVNQLPNSEIIRTDGNEFLIYLVGMEEKVIVSYLRKLNKEFKNLSHGFGAASGYSIIKDPIKTIDDAVNEATLEMKNNKEDIEY